MAGRGEARDVDDVLDADRHAMQRTAQASRHRLRFGRLRGLQRGLAIELDEGVEPGVEAVDALQERVQELDGREVLGHDRLSGSGNAEPVQLANGSVPHRPSPARIGGQGSMAGSVGCLIFSITASAWLAAAATSSGNSASALTRPARRASNSIVILSMGLLRWPRSARLASSVHCS